MKTSWILGTFLVAFLATPTQAENCTPDVRKCARALKNLGYDAHCHGNIVTGAQSQINEQRAAQELTRECGHVSVIGPAPSRN